MPTLHTFSALAIAELREIARRVLREERAHKSQDSGRQHDTPALVYVGKTSGSITARSTDTAGTGSMLIHYCTTANLLTPGSTSPVTVKNMTTHAINSQTWIQAKQDTRGTLWVDVESCTT